MFKTALSKLACPICSTATRWHGFDESDDRVKNGVVACDKCNEWFPIEGYLLDFLVGDVGYPEDRRRFWEKHSTELEKLGHRLVIADETGDCDAQLLQQRHFDSWAENEDQSYTEYSGSPFWEAMDRVVFSEWRSRLSKDDWLLDVGCAEGRSTFQFMDEDINIIGFDVSKRLVQLAIDRYEAGDHRARASFIAADASKFPAQEAALDIVLLYGVLHHLPDVGAGCAEISRVLKPGGLYFGHENNQSFFRRIFDVLQVIWPQWHEEAGAEPLISSRDLKQHFGSSVELKTKTSVFVLPHVVNLCGKRFGAWLFNTSDAIGSRVPWLSGQGGIVLILGQKNQASS